MNIEKIKAYIGFSIKSGKVIFGSDRLFEGRIKPRLTLISSTQNEKVTRKVIKFCESNDIEVIKLDIELESLINFRNCKVLSVVDENLSNAIKNEMENN